MIIGFKDYIIEAEANMSKSDMNGKIHELLVARELRKGGAGEKQFDGHGSAESQKAHEDLKNHIIKTFGKDRYDDEAKKAVTAAEGIRKHLGTKKIDDVGLVSKAGDIGKFTKGKHNLSQQDDASDIMIHHGNGEYTGISLKSSEKHNAAVGFHNEGHGAVDSRLKVDTKHHIKTARQNIVNRHTELAGMTDKQAKEHLKKDASADKTASFEGRKALSNIADDWHKAYSNMSSEHLAHHLRHVMHAQATVIPHIRSTTSGQNGDHKNHIVSPATEHDKYIHDHKNITVTRVGNSGIQWSHKDPKTGKVTKLANERAKFASGVASSVKTSVN